MGNTMRLTGRAGQRRAALFATTALSAALLPALARAQLAPDTTPAGGTVVAGSARIAQAPGETTVTQTSARAAINWQSFNVGSAAQVRFKQPDAGAIALNRVVGGNLSEIDGKITANGQIVLINQSGVVFAKGSQINAESVVVSTAEISDKNFMAGNMAFAGAAKPGADIVNNGSITAGEAGLVGLVAPQVANSGVITARLGQVVLAGATAFTLDLYGDRLMSLDVTRAVTAVDVGGKAVPALVTNRGLILADGGQITLTAQDADALVTQLIDAGGTIRADTVGNRTGMIALNGIGGDISIAGNLLARGADGAGGAVAVRTTGTVNVAPQAMIDASGATGGGVVALGTDLARAEQGAADKTAPAAAAVTVASGAVIRADATGLGNGGKVALLSQTNTKFAGAISVAGGAASGDGGTAEISSRGVIELGGTVLATAAHGRAGEILLDPATLVVGTGTPQQSLTTTSSITTIGGFTGTDTSYIDPATIDSLAGTIILQAGTLLNVASSIDMATSGSVLSLVSNGNIDINAGITVGGGALIIGARDQVAVNSPLAASTIELISGASGTSIGALVSAGSTLGLQSGGDVTETGAGGIDTGTLTAGNTIAGASLTLSNTIGSLGNITLSGGNFALDDNGPLTITAAISTTGHVTLNAGSVDEATGGALDVGTFSGNASGGNYTLPELNEISTLAGLTADAGTINLSNGESLHVAGAVSAEAITLSATSLSVAADINASAAVALAMSNLVLSGGTIGGDTISLAPNASATVIDIGGALANDLDLSSTLLGSLNTSTLVIGTAGTFSTDNITVGGTVDLAGLDVRLDAGTIGIGAGLSAANIALVSGSGGTSIDGLVNAGTLLSLDSGGIISEGTAGGMTAVTLAGSASSATLDDGTSSYTHNSIGTLAGFSASSGDFGLGDNVALDVTGAVSLASGQTIILASPTLTVGAPLAAPSGEIALAADTLNSTATISAATIAIAPLTDTLLEFGGSTTGALTLLADLLGSLAATTVDIGSAAGFAAGSVVVAGTINLPTATSALLVSAKDGISESGSLTAVDLSGTDIVLNAGSGAVGIGGVISGTSVNLSLAAGDGITETTGGSLAVDLLHGAATGAVLLTLANSIRTLGNFAVAGTSGLSLADADALTLGGTLSLGGAVTLDAAGLSETDAALLRIGTLTTGAGSIGGGAVLTAGTNSITTLGAFTLAAGDDLTLDDVGLLDIGGAVSTSGGVILSDANGISEVSGGVIDAGSLAATASGGAIILGNTNSIASLAGFSAGGGNALSLTDGQALTITGLATTTGTLTLQDAGFGVTQTGTAGLIDAGVLTTGAGSIGGDAVLTLGNDIGTLSAFTLAGGDLTLNDTVALLIGGVVTTSGAVDLAATDLTETGAVDAGTFGGLSGSFGSVVLTLDNAIGTLDAFTVSGLFALKNTIGLDVAGGVNAGGITLIAPSLGVGAVLTAGTSGGILALAADTISVADGSLAAPDGTIEIAPDTVANLAVNGTGGGALNLPGSFFAALDPSAALLLGKASTYQAGNITLAGTASVANALVVLGQSGGIADSGLLTVGTAGAGTLAFGGTGFAQSGGGIVAGLLDATGTIGGNVDLLAGSNTISTLGLIDAGGFTIALANAAGLDVAGPLTASVIALTAPSLNIAGTLSATDTVALSADMLSNSGSAAVNAPFVVLMPDADTAIDLGGTSPGALDIGAAFLAVLTPNSVLQIGTGNATINESGNLTIAQNTLLLDGPAIAFGGSLTVDHALELASSGAVTQSAGVINAGTLLSEGAIGGAVSLLKGNVIATLGGLAGDVGIALSDSANLTLTGALTAPDLVVLDDAGTITASTGVINAGTFGSGTGVIGAAVLTNGNSIGLVTGVSASGALDLTDTIALGAGALTAGSVTLNAPGIAVETGGITAGTVVLNSTAGITEPGGVITATLLTGTDSGGDALLTNTAANAVTTVSDFTVSTDNAFALDNADALTIAGGLSAPVVSLSAPSLAIAGTISAATSLALASSGTVSETGAIDTALLTGSAADAFLNGSNAITTASDLTASGTLDLADGNALTIAGTVGAPSTTLTAPGISIFGTLTAASLLSLVSNGGVSETGVIDAGQLSGTDSGGDVLLGNTLNNIATLANFSIAGGTLVLAEGAPLTLAGNVAAMAITLSAPSMDFAGTLDVTDDLLLASTGALTQTGGVINTPLLRGSGTIGGDVFLTGANAITTLSDLTLAAGGTLDLTDATALTLAGTVDAASTTLMAPGITLAGQLIAAGNLALASTGGISEGGGSIATPLLTGSVTGSADFTNFNLIGAIGSFAASGTLAVENAQALEAANITAAGVTLTAAGLALNGIDVGGGTLALSSSGGITEPGGVITAGTLTGFDTGGDVILALANHIAMLNNFFTNNDNFSLNNGVDLTAENVGAVNGNHTLALNDQADLNIDGSLTASAISLTAGTMVLDGVIIANELALGGTGNISQSVSFVTGGLDQQTSIIRANSVVSIGTVGGSVILDGANQIGTLGGFAVSAADPANQFALFSPTVLTVTGPLSAPNATITAGDLTIAGAVDVPGTLFIDSPGVIDETTGTIAAGTLTGGGLDGITLANANSINVLGSFVNTFAPDLGFTLDDIAPLTIAGLVADSGDIVLDDTGAISETSAGAIETPLLDLAGTDITLDQGNAIGLLGNVTGTDVLIDKAGGIGDLSAQTATFNAAADFTMSGQIAVANNLSVNSLGTIAQTDGRISAASATLDGAQAITLAGTASIAGALDLISRGDINATGRLTAGTLTGTGGRLADFAGRTDIATLGSFILTDSNFILDNDGPLALIGPVVANRVSLTVNGKLTLDGTAGGGLYIAGGLATSNTPVPRPEDSIINIDGPGAQLAQIGTFSINPTDNYASQLSAGGPGATVFLTANNGNIAFAPTGAGVLYAPGVDLIADAGTAGTISGQVDLRGLLVMAGTSQLDGYIDGVGGEAAAAKGFVAPQAKPDLRFNACPIMSVNCTILPIESLPLTNPLQNFDLEQRKRRELNHDVQLPGIATRDF